MSIVLQSSGGGSVTLQEAVTASNLTITVPAVTGTMATTTTPSFTTTIGVGGATPAASGAGITFPATQSASSDANTLDDYEEGTFTPTLNFSSGSVTYLERSAQYTKIGRMVNCTIAIYLSAISSPSGDLSITGMPFTAGSGERFVSGFSIGLARNFASSLTITGYISSASSTVILSKNTTNNSYSPLSGSDLGSNTGFYITLTYATA